MNVRSLILLVLLALWHAPAGAQGFAGLGAEADAGFAVPEPGRPLVFPRDHAAHPDYRIEWWYLTATLTGADGRDYGVQWTLFRSALAPGQRPGWDSPQVWMGHAGLTTPDRHFVAERLARDGIGQAGVTLTPFTAWIDDWQMQGETGTPDALDRLALTARGAEFAYDLRLSAEGPLVPQGDRGYSVKSPSGQASWYYSQPFYRITGTLELPEGPMPVTGRGWLDREWSSQPLDPDQTGWDWISLHLDDGNRLMGFQLRSREGPPFVSGTWITPDGTPQALPPGALRMEPLRRAQVAGREVPVVWRVELPSRGLDVTLTALRDDAWMDTLFPYWEGPVRVTGSHPGRGYLEMTGHE